MSKLKYQKLPESYAAADNIQSPGDSYKKFKEAIDQEKEADNEYYRVDNEYFSGPNAKRLDELKEVRKPANFIGKVVYRRTVARELAEVVATSKELGEKMDASRQAKYDAYGSVRVAEEAGAIHFEQNEAAYVDEAIHDAAQTSHDTNIFTEPPVKPQQ